MNASFANTRFYHELESSLAASTGEQRKKWAITIIENNITIKELSGLLKCEQKIATRFLWMLSDIGILNSDKLLAELPFLLDFCSELKDIDQTCFASLWHYSGVPPENESKAIDLLFQWIQSGHTNVSIKARAIWVLQKLTKKYPELKNELKLCLQDQMDKYSKDFKKRAVKILAELEQ